MRAQFFEDTDPNNLDNAVQDLKRRMAALERSYVYANNLEELVGSGFQQPGYYRPPGSEQIYDGEVDTTTDEIDLYPYGDIPPGRNMYVRLLLRTNRVGTYSEGTTVTINSDSGSNYSYLMTWSRVATGGFTGNGASGSGVAPPNVFYVTTSDSPSNEFSSWDLIVYNYASDSMNKNYWTRGFVRAYAHIDNIWQYYGVASWHPSTPTPITSIKFNTVSGGGGGLFEVGCKWTVWID